MVWSMAYYRSDPVSVSKAQASKWFARASVGPVFLSRDGRAFRLSETEAETVRGEAEARLITLHQRMTTRTYIMVFAFVASIIGFTTLSAKLPESLQDGAKSISWFIYSLHGVWIMYEAFAHQRAVNDVRDNLGKSLGNRAPLPENMVEKLTRGNPFQSLVIGIVLGVFVVAMAADQLAHHGFDIIERIPMEAYLAIVPITWIAAFLANRYDRKRGVG
jgi:hypothetical protein